MNPRQTLLHHRVDGPAGASAPPGDTAAKAPALLLGPSLGTSLSVWDPQVPALARTFRVVRWDLPGHGGSPAALLPADATVADLGRLVLDLADALGIDRFAYAGISLGGAVGTWLAAHHPQRVTSLALVCSAARFGPPEPWRERAELVRAQGPEPVARTAPTRWFTPDFAAGGEPAVAALLADHRAADPEGYAACCAVLASCDLRADLPAITAPTLVVGGREDPATPPERARELADGIPGASLTEIARAAHLASVEQPRAVLAALWTHLTDEPLPHEGQTGARHALGTAVRRAVLGDAHVDRAAARTSEFTAPFQDFITRYAWGEIWADGTLDRRTRSSVTLATLVAGQHHDELALHVRAALRNGLSAEEIGAVLLHCALYCGLPAVNAAFAVAERVLSEEDRGGGNTA